MIDADRDLWERQRREPARAYEAFRSFRDLGPLRSLDDLDVEGVSRQLLRRWSSSWAWARRARAWDDHAYRAQDASRLDALREMHGAHADAGRAALQLAREVLARLQPGDVSAGVAVRLLDVGTRLERLTLASTLAQLQGVDVTPLDVDPWDVIADELRGSAPALGHAAPS